MNRRQSIEQKSDKIDVQLEPISFHEHGSTPLLDKPAVAPRGWPASSRSIKPSIYQVLLNLILNVTLLTFSTSFLIFALIVRYYDEAPTQLHPRATSLLLSATKYGPTVFPILFASVVGRATHTILVWRLERGERIGVLDLLAGSTSLTSTVASQLQLRMLSLIGIALITIWTLSPLGGQASIRQMTVGTKVDSHSSSFEYVVPTDDFWIYEATDRAAYTAIVNSLFVSALIGPPATKSSALDAWGNVKIPIIEQYEKSSAPDNGGWYSTKSSNNDENTIYASLNGVPIAGINSSAFVNYKMNIETMYLHLNCSIIVTNSSGNKVPPGAFNITNQYYNMYISWYDDTSKDLGHTNRSQVPPNELSPFVFTYASFLNFYMIQCSVTTTYVEVEVYCPTLSKCTATRLRRSRMGHPPPASTILDTSPMRGSNWYWLATNLLSSVGGRPVYQTLLDFYLTAPDNPAAMISSSNQPSASAEEYGIRLGHLINTYWNSISGIYTTSGGITNDTTKPDTNMTFYGEYRSNQTSALTWVTQGTQESRVEVIKAHAGWVVALSIASTVLILASLMPLIVRMFFIRSPDIMMNISSLATRNNPYLPLPVNGTFMNASDRSKLLKDVKIRFGDVDSKADIGSLAIGASEGSGDSRVERISKGRHYE